MILLPFLLLSIIFVYRIDTRVGKFSVIYVVSVLLIHTLYILELHTGNIDYFISDEAVFMGVEGAHQLSEIAKGDRLLWFKVLEMSAIGDLTGGLFSKLISLIFLPFLLLLVRELNRDSNIVYYVFFFCPYLLFVTQTALRDIFILTLSLGIFYLLCNKHRFGVYLVFYLLVFSICLFMLRPFYLFAIVLIYYAVYHFDKVSRVSLAQKVKSLFWALIVVFIVATAGYFIFQSKVEQYLRSITFIMENGISLDESKTSVKPSLTFSYLLYSTARYITTPIPLSLIERIFTEPTKFGYVDDFMRLLNQSLLYVMYMYILVNARCLFNVWRSLLKSNYTACFTIFTILNTLLYSLYYAGGGHSRLKLVYFIFVFIICERIYSIKLNGSKG